IRTPRASFQEFGSQQNLRFKDLEHHFNQCVCQFRHVREWMPLYFCCFGTGGVPAPGASVGSFGAWPAGTCWTGTFTRVGWPGPASVDGVTVIGAEVGT